MSSQTIYQCDLCNKQLDPDSLEYLSTIVVNHYDRKKYQNKAEEHFCVELDICSECNKKYKLTSYRRKEEAVNFIKEKHGFLSNLWRKVNGYKEDR